MTIEVTRFTQRSAPECTASRSRHPVAPEVFAEIEAAFNRRGILVALRRVIRRPNAALEMLSRDFVGVITSTAPTPLIGFPGARRRARDDRRLIRNRPRAL